MKKSGSAVHRNSIVYRCLTPDPAQALLLGNGRMGGSLHTPDDSLYLLVSRSDLWNENAAMGAIAAVRIRGNQGLFQRARSVRQECSLEDAAIRIVLETDEGLVRIEVTCLRLVDLISVEIHDERREPSPFEAVVENWHEGDSTASLPGWGEETLHLNLSSCFAEINRRVKVDAAEVGLSDPLLGRGWGLFTSAASFASGRVHRLSIATVCHPPEEGKATSEAALREAGLALLKEAEVRADILQREHQEWWASFWERSYIALESGTGDAEYEERLWYANLYYIACASGGAYPARFNGGLFLLDRDSRDWDYGYWFQNMREVYWPLIAAGHWQWMRDFFRMYLDAVPFVQRQTEAILGVEGIAFRETQAFWGAAPDINLLEDKTNFATSNNFSSLLEVCLLMEWYSQASGDEKFRNAEYYPFLCNAIAFYRRYARKGADGTYHISPANALEVWPNARDSMPDICGLRTLLPRLIAWGAKRGERAELLAEWEEFLENLAPVPIGRWTLTRRHQSGIHQEEWHIATEHCADGIFLPAGDKTSEKARRHNMENAELYLVFPWGLIGLDSSDEEKRRFENTWNSRTWRFINNGWAQDVPQLARMGWAEEARKASLEHASYSQRFPNGSFICPGAPRFHGLLTATPYLDSCGVHLTGVHEMLLQSYDGILRLAPSISVEWSGRFKLHALGGWIVEACFVQGQPVSARITATRPRLLRLRNSRREVMHVGACQIPSGELLSAVLADGDTVEVCWDGVSTGSESVGQSPRPEVIYPGYKIRPPQPCWRTGHWHDERKGHGQVGLAEDGLFAATR